MEHVLGKGSLPPTHSPRQEEPVWSKARELREAKPARDVFLISFSYICLNHFPYSHPCPKAFVWATSTIWQAFSQDPGQKCHHFLICHISWCPLRPSLSKGSCPPPSWLSAPIYSIFLAHMVMREHVLTSFPSLPSLCCPLPQEQGQRVSRSALCSSQVTKPLTASSAEFSEERKLKEDGAAPRATAACGHGNPRVFLPEPKLPVDTGIPEPELPADTGIPEPVLPVDMGIPESSSIARFSERPGLKNKVQRE